MMIRIALIAAIMVCSAELLAEDSPGGAHVVAGSAYIAWDDGISAGEWQHIFAVTQSPNGEPRGQIRERIYDAYPDLVLDNEFVTEVDCLEIDEETGEAWIGGEVTSVTVGPDQTIGEFPPLGTKVVVYADDNDGSYLRTDNPDLRGNIFIGWEWGVPPWLTCHDRVGPWGAVPLSRGKIIVR